MKTAQKYQISWKEKFCTTSTLDQALQAGCTCHVCEGSEGLSFPLYTFDEELYVGETGQVACFWLNVFGGSAPPNMLLNADAYSPRYYVLPGTKAAIAEANGTCFIVNLVTEVLMYREIGLYNVIYCLPQETPIPHDLVNALERLDVQTVIYGYEQNARDQQFVVQLFYALENTKIKFFPFCVSETVAQVLSYPLFSTVHLR